MEDKVTSNAVILEISQFKNLVKSEIDVLADDKSHCVYNKTLLNVVRSVLIWILSVRENNFDLA